MRNSFYFPHDYYARHDPKLSALIKIYGAEGYGVWWNLIEILHEQAGRLEKFPLLYEGLAQELKLTEVTLQKIVNALINDFHLLKENETHIWSNRVLQNIQIREKKRLQRVEAGRLGGIISGKKRSKTKQNEATLEANEANEAKERKVKESKGNKSKVNKIKEKDIKTPEVVEKSFSSVSEIKNYFYSRFREVFGRDYVASHAIDGRIFKDLLEKFSIDGLKEMINIYLNEPDEFLEKTGYTVKMFLNRINVLGIAKRTLIYGEKGMRGIMAAKIWLEAEKKKEEETNVRQE